MLRMEDGMTKLSRVARSFSLLRLGHEFEILSNRMDITATSLEAL
jgi:hypothetical protein